MINASLSINQDCATVKSILFSVPIAEEDGCGSAGYTDEQIAPLFAYAYSLPNVFLPASFWKILSFKFGQY